MVMFLLRSLTVLCLIIATCQAKSIKKAQANLLEPNFGLDDWQGKWFPYAPGEPHIPKVQRVPETTTIPNTKDDWRGKWFPYAPGEPHVIKQQNTSTSAASEEAFTDSWNGNWFPQAPNERLKQQVEAVKTLKETICDDGMRNLAVDYDPNDVGQSFNILCISNNRSTYDPNMSREAVLTEHFLPSAYVPPSKCLNVSIEYTHLPPTNGQYRPMPAEYGTYSYLPPQRYMRNLAEGAIVMMYHPCAFQGQVDQLQQIVGGCLYRHLITPSQSLSPERPLALLAWSHILEMSVVDKHLVADFIKKYAKQGPLAVENLSRLVNKRESYKVGLQTEARLVTSEDDAELCGYLGEQM
ncbi:uncharacterized protein LOC6602722 [Drosophila persimilis]|uniref:uncharacterized protein LOC6602722 n=1 Tax=Drosophila persimilis TaxID=7234 RepID=UPI000F08DC29|nr:uncharacterized protein LOC6602722 [Drosophila persimilis]